MESADCRPGSLTDYRCIIVFCANDDTVYEDILYHDDDGDDEVSSQGEEVGGLSLSFMNMFMCTVLGWLYKGRGRGRGRGEVQVDWWMMIGMILVRIRRVRVRVSVGDWGQVLGGFLQVIALGTYTTTRPRTACMYLPYQ